MRRTIALAGVMAVLAVSMFALYAPEQDAAAAEKDEAPKADMPMTSCPRAIYAQAEALGLSEEQRTKLIEIQEQARKNALAVLTPEQRKTLAAIPDTPMAMMQACRQKCAKKMPKMQKMMSGKGKGGTMTCPMMTPAGAGGAAPGSGTKRVK